MKKDKYIFQSCRERALPPANGRTVLERCKKVSLHWSKPSFEIIALNVCLRPLFKEKKVWPQHSVTFSFFSKQPSTQHSQWVSLLEPHFFLASQELLPSEIPTYSSLPQKADPLLIRGRRFFRWCLTLSSFPRLSSSSESEQRIFFLNRSDWTRLIISSDWFLCFFSTCWLKKRLCRKLKPSRSS